MSNENERVEYGEKYQIFVISLSIINIIIFSHISYGVLTKILFNQQKLNKLHVNKFMLQIATAFWITNAIISFFRFLLLHNLIISYPDSCSINSSCFQCDVIFMIYQFLWYGNITAKLLVYAVALKINFYPVATNKKCYRLGMNILQMWIILILSVTSVVNAFRDDYGLSALSDSNSKYICKQQNDPLTNGFMLVMVILIFGTAIMIVACFLCKSCVLLGKTSSQICKSEFSRDMTYKKLKRSMAAIIRHTIISTASIIVPFLLIVLPQILYCDIDLEPIEEFLDGMLIFMLFSFGGRQYRCVFGKLHRFILKGWINKHEICLTSEMRKSSDGTESSKTQELSDRFSNKSHTSGRRLSGLSPIEELSENTKHTTTDVFNLSTNTNVDLIIVTN